MTRDIATLIDLDLYPIHRPDSAAYADLVRRCQADLAQIGMFNLNGFMKDAAITESVSGLKPTMDTASFVHQREHNIYFLKDIPGLAPDHPALTKCKTVNHTLCADQIADNPISDVYNYTSLADFLSVTMQRPTLYLMDDPLARLNVMAYRDGETLNWHFDRSEFTTTLLLQAPDKGGEFIYRTDLRSPTDPNYDGVGQLLRGEDPAVNSLTLRPGTLNVFKGLNTAHKVGTVQGDRERIIAVFSYYEKPGVRFTADEQIGFYGRAA